MRDVRRIDRGRGLRGGPGKRADRVFLGRPQSFRHQCRPVEDCSPGREEMAQDGGTRGGTFHGEMDRCRAIQGCTTACSSMPERDGKDQGEENPKQAGSHAIVNYPQVARTCILRAFSLQMPCRLSPVLHIFLFCFVFVFLLSLKPWSFVQSFFVLRYACVPTATRGCLTAVCVFFVFVAYFFCFFGDVAFSECSISVPLPFSSCMESTWNVSPFGMLFFYLVTTGWIFCIIVCEHSINSINHGD